MGTQSERRRVGNHPVDVDRSQGSLIRYERFRSSVNEVFPLSHFVQTRFESQTEQTNLSDFAHNEPESVASPAQQLAAPPGHLGVLSGGIIQFSGGLLEASVPAGDELPAGRDFESLNSTVEAQSALSKHGYWCSRTKNQRDRRFGGSLQDTVHFRAKSLGA